MAKKNFKHPPIVIVKRRVQPYEIAVVRERGGFIIKMFLNSRIFAESDVFPNILDAVTSFYLDYS